MSLAEMELGRTMDAIGHLEEAGRIFDERDLHLDAAMTLNGLGEAYAKAGELRSARLHLLRALRLSRSCGSKYEEARARRGLGSVSRADRPRLALHHWERALHHYTELGSPEAEVVRVDRARACVAPGFVPVTEPAPAGDSGAEAALRGQTPHHWISVCRTHSPHALPPPAEDWGLRPTDVPQTVLVGHGVACEETTLPIVAETVRTHGETGVPLGGSRTLITVTVGRTR